MPEKGHYRGFFGFLLHRGLRSPQRPALPQDKLGEHVDVDRQLPRCGSRPADAPRPITDEATAGDADVRGDESFPAGALENPPLPPRVNPKIFPPSIIHRNRIAGSSIGVKPDAVTIWQMCVDRQTQVVASIMMCVDTDGAVSIPKVLTSSGYPEYERKLQDTMRQWRYRPFVINGDVVPVCTSQTFIFRTE